VPTPRWPAAILWIAIIVGLSIALARIAVWLQTAHFAAIGVFPVLLGVVIGLSVVWIGRQLNLYGRRTMMAGAIMAASLIAATEHALFYFDYRNQFSSAIQSNPKSQLAAALAGDQFQPASFYRFMAAEAPAKWPLWIADALAMIAVAAVVAYLMDPSARRTVLSITAGDPADVNA